MDDKLYSVSVIGERRVNIIDARRGVTVNSFTLQGKLVTGPNVTGNQCTYVVEMPTGQRRGYIRKLPSGIIQNSFRAS
jgi:hypothetical protein